MEKKSKLKKNIPNIILALFFMVGLAIFLYPSASDLLNEWARNFEVSQYETQVAELSTEAYDNLIKSAQDYNNTLIGHTLKYNQEAVPQSNYYDLLKISGTKIIGYLKIPKIDVRLPIYHGSDASVLQIGIGHFEGTSLPTPGDTVHTVLLGHTGLPSSKLLTDLNQLQAGDTFNIVVLNQIYTYEVDQILVVEPNDTDALELINGQQYATIVTCTPYRINTHRLLVRGKMINNKPTEGVPSEAVVINSSVIIQFISIPIIIVVFIILISIRKRKKQNIAKKSYK